MISHFTPYIGNVGIKLKYNDIKVHHTQVYNIDLKRQHLLL